MAHSRNTTPRIDPVLTIVRSPDLASRSMRRALVPAAAAAGRGTTNARTIRSEMRKVRALKSSTQVAVVTPRARPASRKPSTCTTCSKVVPRPTTAWYSCGDRAASGSRDDRADRAGALKVSATSSTMTARTLASRATHTASSVTSSALARSVQSITERRGNRSANEPRKANPNVLGT